MYKVTDKDGHTIYLLGTLHMMSQETLPIANLDETLATVDRVILEVSEADMEKAAKGSVTVSDLGSVLSSMMQMFTLDNGLSQETLELVAGF
ncbi:MAG: TraB/GumN family protein, partial [Clostridiales bacterium]|nr:TraB/GumN family protein [Clostridiales bacterium]